MKTDGKHNYSDRIRQRIRGLWLLLALIILYMVIVGEMGLGDSRYITDFAKTAGTLIIFGGQGLVIYQIVRNRRLLHNPWMLKQQELEERDERNRYLHNQSGGVAFDAMFWILVFVTVTASLCNMPVFYVSFGVLTAGVAIKVGAYLWYRENG